MQENGYFKIEIENGHSFLCIFPPATEAGEPVSVDEIMKYLESHRYMDVDPKSILRTMADLKTSNRLDLGIFDGMEMAGAVRISVSLDKMKVTCRMYPPTSGGMGISIKDVKADLENRGIVYGIDEASIAKMVTTRVYCTDFIIATGKAPEHGIDARIEYNFSVDKSLKPKLLDDGTVDFFNIDTISHVKKDQQLALLHPAIIGAPGKDVYGNVINQRQAKGVSLFASANTYLSEDKFKLFSAVNGHAYLANDIVMVSDEFEVPENVDLSTGNIIYDGSVHVKGNVCEGFSVEADGDVIVDGVIEGATIKCGGQVIIRRGIQGQGKVYIEAASNVFCKYIENATIVAGGYVEADSIINSNITAKGDVIAVGKKGIVLGGIVHADCKIEVNYAGNELGVSTLLEVGIDSQVKAQFTEVQKRMTQTQSEIAKLDPVLNVYARALNMGKELDEKQASYMQLVNTKMRQLKQQMEDDRALSRSLQQELYKSNSAKIVVNRTAYPGVRIRVSGSNKELMESWSSCQFRSKHGEIEIVNQ